MDNRCIGIFDSGVGGLTIADEVMRTMPDEGICYLGDTARVPYGSKSRETVTEYGRQAIRFLISKDVKAIIIACGTISANSYDTLLREFTDTGLGEHKTGVPLIEIVTSGVDAVKEFLKTRNADARATRLGIIATEATIRSSVYEAKLSAEFPGLIIRSKACPLFVPLAEEGWSDNEVAELMAGIYLKELINTGIDALLLACTHYPLLIKGIKKACGKDITVINPAEANAARVMSLLDKYDIKCGSPNARRDFYVSSNTEKFERLCADALGIECRAHLVDLQE